MKIKSTLFLLLILLTSFAGFCQNAKILHYSETSGFDHNTRSNSLAMFRSFPNLNVVNDLNGRSFDSLSSLLNYDLIVFSNTSGSNILDSSQRAHFEIYMMNGGNLMGIHAASDTYRHSTANGNNTGVWDFYANTLGGSVQQSPNHVAGTPNYDIRTLINHPSTLGLPLIWSKNEEYYYWENGYLDSTIQVILEVEETIGPNNQVNSYDSARAVSWYKENLTTANNRIFYTSLGHANSNYTSDTLFQKHIRQATEWCIGRINSLQYSSNEEQSFKISPNPSNGFIKLASSIKDYELKVYSLDGKVIESYFIHESEKTMDLSHLNSGVYLLKFNCRSCQETQKLIIR